MNVTVDLTDLRKALTTTKGAIPRAGQTPVLRGVRLTAGSGKLAILATNLDTTIATEIPADVTTEGIAVIAHDLLVPMAKGKGSLNLTVADERAIVTRSEQAVVTRGVTATLALLPADEFPTVPERLDSEVFELDRTALASVLLAVSTDDAKPVLCGVLFNGEEIVATDSYRLHIAQIAGGHFPKTLVMGAALAKVAKSKSPVTIRFGERWVELESDAGVVHGRVIEGEFPNYRQLIPNPKGMPVRILVKAAEMAAAVTHVKQYCRDYTTPVRVELAPDSITCIVRNSLGASDATDVSVEVPATVEGSDVCDVISWNPKYLLDVIAGGRSEILDIRAIDKLKPSLVLDTDVDMNLVRLIMPVRTP